MSVKTVALATVFVFGAGLLALYAAWQLDESKKLVRTNVVEQSEEDGTLVIEMKERLGDDFIVLCPEERFQEAFDELRSFVEVSTEPLYFPGGPMALAFAEFEIPDNLAPAHRVLQDFLRRYSPGRVVLVSHSECLYYESLTIFDNSLDGVQERQLQDLDHARTTIRQWLPNAEVELDYADKVGDRLTVSRQGPSGNPER